MDGNEKRRIRQNINDRMKGIAHELLELSKYARENGFSSYISVNTSPCDDDGYVTASCGVGGQSVFTFDGGETWYE